MNKIISLFLLCLLSVSSHVNAQDIGGCFQATQSCEAYQSFRKQTNPGDIRLDQNIQYKVLENSKKMKAYRLQINGIDKAERWVSKSCGDWLQSCTINKEQINNKRAKKKVKNQQQYLLALTWQPSFCDKSSKKECLSQTSNRYDARHLSLHGLWPQPRNNTYCGVNYIDKGIDRNSRWHLLEPVKLSQKTAQELAFIMPGMVSNLHRHEWVKHGTCYGTDADEYYADSIYLTNEINNSSVGDLFSQNIGKKLSLKEIRKRFDQAFGKGTGSKVDLRCDQRGLIAELWVNLSGDIHPKASMASLLNNAVNADSSCYSGIVDRANK